ncbi:hypothetical protein ASPCADRAFT_8094 [Aspergillus carbonarius ITEM 5010]|uniref:Uncharacterized protein n=1 Tax=Aspergillus carbonarius (strain ITEM 5010) TaxID=602072 RepID=A0A1R3RFB6_ASPC5|nr:hypothetical protein ASPCADRAFT_8094 [Aspergillus carbonarius ITEM 5010]
MFQIDSIKVGILDANVEDGLQAKVFLHPVEGFFFIHLRGPEMFVKYDLTTKDDNERHEGDYKFMHI